MVTITSLQLFSHPSYLNKQIIDTIMKIKNNTLQHDNNSRLLRNLSGKQADNRLTAINAL